MSEWTLCTFDTAPLEIIDGDRGTNYPKQQDFSDFGYCLFLNAGNVTERGFDFTSCQFITQKKDAALRKGKLQRNDIVLTTRGTVGRLSWYNSFVPFENIRINSGMVILRVNDSYLDPQFLYLYMRSNSFSEQLKSLLSGSAQPQLPIRDIKKLKLYLPPLSEQREITRILGALDDKIELNRRMNATLEATARALFQSWFVDFDPVRARAEGRDPVGMDADTAALFPDHFEESELGLIPAGWRVEPLERLIALQKGLSYKGEFLSDTGMPMINLGCFLGSGRFSSSNIKHYLGEYKERHLVHTGDLVIANTDMTQKRVILGSPAIVPPNLDHSGYLITHHVYAARFNADIETWRLYIYYSLLQPIFRERIIGFATGTTVLALPQDALLKQSIIAPDLGVISSFNSLVTSLHDQQVSLTTENHLLAETRDALLPKLISGEVRVGDSMND